MPYEIWHTAYGQMVYRKRTWCRACEGQRLRRFLSLSPQPLANAFLRSPDEFVGERLYPLEVYFCEDCSLVQILDVIDPELLFRHYVYLTGTSETIAAHNQKYARDVVETLKLEANDLVVEIASNDGSLLKCFRPYGVKTLGVEPATNIAEIAGASGIETVNKFFNSATAEEIRQSYGPARAVIGNNVLAHVDDTLDFLRGCDKLLAEDGLVIIEVPYLRDLLDRVAYDTIYHEHHCYFSVTSLERLCVAAGLTPARIDRLPVHGGTLRMYAGPRNLREHRASEIEAMIEDERSAGMSDIARYEKLAADVAANRRDILSLLEGLKGEGKAVAGYGAPAKGNTLLNYCGITTNLLPYTVDKSPLKIGLYTPGTHIPVAPVSTLIERQPDYVVILAWNFAEEIMRQQREYRERGGRFIIPIPTPAVV
ncbi:MAG: class I SAM-dependent methyltransferase [Gemmataceae bacterium]|nr:class I SAM-dependent methyltransferase [Gemmataceae bacterium]